MSEKQDGADESSTTKTQSPDILNELENLKPFVYRICFGVFHNSAECNSCDAAHQCKDAMFVRY